MKKETFLFYADWLNVIRDLPSEVQLEVYQAIAEYAIYGNLIELKPLAKVAFGFVKQTIDRDTQKYISISEKRSEAGKKGGRRLKDNELEESNEKQKKQLLSEKSKKSNCSLNDNDNVNVNDNDDKDASAITDEKKYYSSDNGVIKSISELKRDYLNDENLCNAIIKNLKVIDKNMLSEQLEAFNQHLELQGERLKEVRDYRSHFKNWLKKRQEVAKNTPVTTAPKRIRFDENGNEITY